MQYWQDGGVLTLLFVAVLILGARQLHRSIPAVRALAVPPVLVAGLLGLLLGGGGLDLVPLQSDLLEMVVYHSLPIIYIALGLRRTSGASSAKSGPGGGMVARIRRMVSGIPPAVRSIGLAIPILAMVQGILGLLVVLAWNGSVGELHPGVGIMVPLGFSQGPGQALALGKAWEGMGMVEGAQIGLAMATLGYVFCALFGVPVASVGCASRVRFFAWAPSSLMSLFECKLRFELKVAATLCQPYQNLTVELLHNG